MGAWGHGLCENDMDHDILPEIGDECGVNLDPLSDEETTEMKQALSKRLDEIVERFYEKGKTSRKTRFDFWSNYNWYHYAVHLVTFVAMNHDVEAEQVTKNLAEYRPGKPMPFRSKGLLKTANERPSQKNDSGSNVSQSSGFDLLNVFPPEQQAFMDRVKENIISAMKETAKKKQNANETKTSGS